MFFFQNFGHPNVFSHEHLSARGTNIFFFFFLQHPNLFSHERISETLWTLTVFGKKLDDLLDAYLAHGVCVCVCICVCLCVCVEAP